MSRVASPSSPDRQDYVLPPRIRAPKRGMAVSVKNFRCNDIPLLNHWSWFYNWGIDPVYQNEKHLCGTKPDELLTEFVSMQWGNFDIPEVGEIYNITGKYSRYFLGFNEPNHQLQSCLDPDFASDLWRRLEGAAVDKTLVSPAAAVCSQQTCCKEIHWKKRSVLRWYDAFFSACEKYLCRIPYLAIHYYSCDAQETMRFLRNLYHRYGRKIWLTEFACPKTQDPAEIIRYMKEILPLLDAAPFVYRYSWFVSRFQGTNFLSAHNSLFDFYSEKPELTPLGEVYLNI